jgi:hypothetical protein
MVTCQSAFRLRLLPVSTSSDELCKAVILTIEHTILVGGRCRRPHSTSIAHFLPSHLPVAHDSGSMEPTAPLAAILGLAGKAWDLGRYIHNVYQGTKTVDTSIRNLDREVQDLASTCDLVHEELASVLKDPASEKHGSPYDPDGALEKCIRGQVKHCDCTIEELPEIAECLWPRKKKFLDRTIRQFRLQDAKEEIEDIRARIRSHTDALHTVLHVLSIKVAHISPGQAMGQLPETLDDLRESISRIEAKLEQRRCVRIALTTTRLRWWSMHAILYEVA